MQLSVYRGRFAPSPTGSLHLGSLVTAVASYLEARIHNGEWLVRIEDVDSTRVIPDSSRKILHALESLGMDWDGEVVYQSQRHTAYQTTLTKLNKNGLIYPCACSRREIADSAMSGVEGPVYSGSCRNGLPGNHADRPHALRVKTENSQIEFVDNLQGKVHQCVESEIGDFVLRRADGIYTYQLAVVVDDAWQGITHVVRGADLLHSTPRQIYLQKLLGYKTPAYLHLPVVVNKQGEKLSKQTQAAPIDLTKPLPQLVAILRFLGQNPPDELVECDINSFWQWALAHWQAEKIPKGSHFINEPE
ncbi:tRNA glutamyl-Q(34) synthetase GluQRS [Nitrosomonas sp. Nm33]|uniref:tRNA glutamyl-Q(34) synthetase GluQRS n=1 Tax=Nitrosomonas sp. Nm33 TaxID=133724 RepID=UPI00089C57CB|nr:tRNA glutamyl-Q(34) synthetase GluQRS [Nitrosomonas sp. Nm33]SDY60491.1 glutamyl-Q tRNA(Asp) synthetase [Nitrosomonas sp. Nm33]